MPVSKKAIITAAVIVSVGAAAGGGYYAWSNHLFDSRQAPAKQEKKPPEKIPAARQAAKPVEIPAKVEPVTVYRPNAVYSGTLGELTGIQAGREIAKANFELRQQELKLQEIEDKIGKSRNPQIQIPPPSAKPAPVQSERFYVTAVKGTGSNLTAVIRSSKGMSYHVSPGDVIPGHGKITSIRKNAVEVEGRPMAWM